MTTQSNNLFFKSFFKKDQMWNQIQNDPIAHNELMPGWRPTRTNYLITQADGSVGAAPIDEMVNFGPVIGNKRLYWDQPLANWGGTLADKPWIRRVDQMREVIKGFGRTPNAASVYQNPATPGYTPAQALAARRGNIRAWIAADRFHQTPVDRNTANFNWVKTDDYWLPHYEGELYSGVLPEKNVKRMPTSSDKDMKFLPSKPFLSDKQKEYYVWSKMDWT